MKLSLILCLLPLTLFACSSSKAPEDTTPTDTPQYQSDGGPDVVYAPDGSTFENPGDATTTPPVPPSTQDCLNQCQAAHPRGVMLAAQIDKCWAAHCSSCTMGGDVSGKVFSPDLVDMADGGDGGLLNCKAPVLTPFVACSDCTVQNCCTEWSNTFLDSDGIALNECSNACWSK